MSNLSIKLNKKQQESILSFVGGIKTQSNTMRSNDRTRNEAAEKKYQMEQSETAKKKNLRGKLDPVIVPTIIPYTEAFVAQMVSGFLTGYPIFQPVGAPEFEDAASMLTGSFIKQQEQFAWQHQLTLLIKDAVKYNKAAVEIVWDAQSTPKISSDASGNAVVTQVKKSGNNIKKLDSYNLILDPTVEASRIHVDGQYAGYVEKITKVNLYRLFENLPKEKIMNQNDALKSSPATADYYIPQILPAVSGEASQWDVFFTNPKQGGQTNNTQGYEVMTLYVRIMPEEFDIKTPESNKVQIWKFVVVNGKHLIYAEIQANAHQYLPILVCQLMQNGIKDQHKTLVEYMVPIQNLCSDLHTAMIASIRKSIDDRIFYNPTKISSKDINTPDPAAKIPVTVGINDDIRKHIFQVPYNSNMYSELLNQSQIVASYSQSITGQNQTSIGKHTPGNKTLQEFDTMMNNSGARTLIFGLVLETQIMTPAKTILLHNTLQYQPKEMIMNTQTKEQVTYDPIRARQAEYAFEVADGANPVSNITNAQLWAAFLQVAATIPEIAKEYNIPDMITYMFKSQGLRYLEKFKKSKEEKSNEFTTKLSQLAQESAVTGKLQPVPPQQTPPTA